tara:strand:- start:50 stop:301 length:252 start_codon:yes stop_codon:yes gene_type:complete
MRRSIKKIEKCFETLLDDVWDWDYKDDDGYEVRITENISAQLIEDVQEAIQEALNKEKINDYRWKKRYHTVWRSILASLCSKF